MIEIKTYWFKIEYMEYPISRLMREWKELFWIFLMTAPDPWVFFFEYFLVCGLLMYMEYLGVRREEVRRNEN